MITVKQKVNELLESGQISDEFLKKIHKNKVNQVPAIGSGTLGKEQIESVKFLEHNRVINVNHVKYLMERMAEDGVVNDVVIAYDNKGNQYAWDGQHKLCACYILGYNAPFTSYYERHLHFSLEEMIKRINTKQKNWDNDDHIHSWIKNGIPFFEEFEKINSQVTGVLKDTLLSVVLGKKDSMQNLKKLKLETLKERVKDITYEDYKEKLELALDLKKRMVNMKSIQTEDRAINSGWLQFLVSQEFDKIPQVMYNFVNYLEKLELQDVVYPPIPASDSNWNKRFKKLFKQWMEGKAKSSNKNNTFWKEFERNKNKKLTGMADDAIVSIMLNKSGVKYNNLKNMNEEEINNLYNFNKNVDKSRERYDNVLDIMNKISNVYDGIKSNKFYRGLTKFIVNVGTEKINDSFVLYLEKSKKPFTYPPQEENDWRIHFEELYEEYKK